MEEKRLSLIINTVKKALQHYKWPVVTLVFVGFLSSLLEGLGVNALIPLFSFVTGQGTRDDIISQFIEKIFNTLGVTFNLKYLLVFISLLFVLKAIMIVITKFIQIKIATDYEEKLRSELSRKTLRASWEYLLEQKLGYLETILKIDIGRALSLLKRSSDIIIIVIGLIIYLTVAINISIYITLITLILALIIFLILKPVIYKIKGSSYKEEKMIKELTYHINENTLGAKTVKIMTAEDVISQRSQQFFKELRKLRIKIYLLRTATGALLQPISIIFISIVFAISYKSSDFNLGALTAIIYLIQRIFQYFQQLQASLHDISETAPYVKSVFNYSNEVTKYKEKDKGTNNFVFNDKITFKNISFAYDKSKKVLSSLNIEIKKGEMIGLIGPSGAGKTTIADLTLRLLEPVSGHIELDGVNITKIKLDKWRQGIGYVSQDIFLLNGTIFDNIKFHNNSIKNKGVIKAAKMANIHNTIMSLKNGYNTEIGERGLNLSAGQRQRIVIARVLARNPKLLILDEATSALDNESEIKIQKVIENIKNKMTIFVIAHRLSTIMNSDKLLVLKNGHIIESGKPEKLLLDKQTYFHKIYNIRKN